METLLLILAAIIIIFLLGLFYYRVHFYSWYINFPNPLYQFEVQKNVMIPMPDGIRLATDIYYPKTTGKCPVIILRTPYNKKGRMHPYKQLAYLFASQGYVFIVQDVRGKYDSDGEYDPFKNEGLDGYTMVEWAGKAPWSNGKVALYGFSYLGSCAWLVVPYNSPYLKTIVPMFTTQNTYSIFYENGIFHLKGVLYWLTSFFWKKTDSEFNLSKNKKISFQSACE